MLAAEDVSPLFALGLAILTATLLLRIWRRGRRGAADMNTAAAPRLTADLKVTEWELRLHDAGRGAVAEVETRAAELRALADHAAREHDRLAAVLGELRGEAHAADAVTAVRLRRDLRMAGYSEPQVDVILAKDADGERRRAA